MKKEKLEMFLSVKIHEIFDSLKRVDNNDCTETNINNIVMSVDFILEKIMGGEFSEEDLNNDFLVISQAKMPLFIILEIIKAILEDMKITYDFGKLDQVINRLKANADVSYEKEKSYHINPSLIDCLKIANEYSVYKTSSSNFFDIYNNLFPSEYNSADSGLSEIAKHSRSSNLEYKGFWYMRSIDNYHPVSVALFIEQIEELSQKHQEFKEEILPLLKDDYSSIIDTFVEVDDPFTYVLTNKIHWSGSIYAEQISIDFNKIYSLLKTYNEENNSNFSLKEAIHNIDFLNQVCYHLALIKICASKLKSEDIDKIASFYSSISTLTKIRHGFRLSEDEFREKLNSLSLLELNDCLDSTKNKKEAYRSLSKVIN